ncbi:MULTISPECIES: hypothetical protein [unclassified Sphingobacterium]|uniref:hypothetical protein n=1 Tax=unclassified Sphingobacterium TaxID=2609468 RepID=UPI0025D8D0B7|nr:MULTISPECIES: hypothetical protein [unclassified Sphingobacterium]
MSNQFLIKDTMAAMRDISAAESSALQDGTYNGVQLLGYYEKGDTPAPIIYHYVNLLNDPDPGPDDGGSVVQAGGIKLEHKFSTDEVDLRYFPDSQQGYLAFFNYCGAHRKIAVIHKDISITVIAKTFVKCPKGIRSLNNNYINIKGNFFFSLDDLVDELVISDINFSTEGLNATMVNNNTPKAIFDIEIGWKESVQFFSLKNVKQDGIPLDLTGETRSRGLVNIKNVQNVRIFNVMVKNIDVALILRESRNIKIDTVSFENVGTGIYGNNIYNAIIQNCTLKNTVEQANNWRGKTANYDLNGKDLIFATGSDITYTKNKSYNPIERNCYFIADNVSIRNCYSLNGDGFKAVGAMGDTFKNVVISNNLLEINDDLVNMPIRSIVLLQCYFINKGLYQNNRIRILSDVSEKTKTVRGIATISRTNGELIFEGNYADHSNSGMIAGVQKTAEELANSGELLAQKLKIINNYTYTEGDTMGAILSMLTVTNSISTLNYFNNVEMYGNRIKLPINNNSVLITGPLALYNIKGAANIKAIDNKILEGRIRYTSGLNSDLAGTSINATLLEDDLTCVDLNSNMIAIRNFVYNKGSVLKFKQVEGKGTVTHYFNDSEKTFGESGTTVIEKSDATNTNFNIQGKEIIVEGSVKGKGYFKSRLVHGINIFEPIVGTMDAALIKYSSNQIQINGLDVGVQYSVKMLVV